MTSDAQGPKRYWVNEVYKTVHGEGARYGIPHVFVRFSGCNLTCGFCDTEFESGRSYTAEELVALVTEEARVPPDDSPVGKVPGAKWHDKGHVVHGDIRNVLFCGGEPLLQVDEALCRAFKDADPAWYIAVETNGSVPCPASVDWVTCSPKVAEHAIALARIDELKYVRAAGQGIPRPAKAAAHYFVSPVFTGNQPDPAALQWCIRLVLNHPGWRLTVQHHKLHFGDLR